MTVRELLDADTSSLREFIKNGKPEIDADELCSLTEDELINVLNKAMSKSYPAFRKCPDQDDGMPLQYMTIKEILKGNDVLAVMPTSMGKSMCFQFPAVIRRGITIIVEPLVALLSDQADKIGQELPSPVAVYVDPYSMDEAQLADKRLLYVSPETLAHDKFVRYIKRRADELQMLVVDEAHCISVWGNEFREDYLKIGQFFDKLGRRPQVVAFTATATSFIRNEIADVLRMKKETTFDIVNWTEEKYPHEIRRHLFIRSNITMTAKELSSEKYKKHLKETAERLADPEDIDDAGIKRMAAPFRQIFLTRSDKKDVMLKEAISYISQILNSTKEKLIDVSKAPGSIAAMFADNESLYRSELYLIKRWCISRLSAPKSETLTESAAESYCRYFAKDDLEKIMFDEKTDQLVTDIFEVLKAGEEDEEKRGSVIIYCSEIATVNKLCDYSALRKGLEEEVRKYSAVNKGSFSRLGKRKRDGKILVPILNYYAELKTKAKNQRSFIANTGEYPVIVATKAFGMGIDKNDIRRVIHFEPPKDIENYFQEVGRGGRDNRPSDAILYIYKPDIEKAEYLLSQEEYAGEKPSARKLESTDMMNYNLQIAIYRFGQFKSRCLTKFDKNNMSKAMALQIADYFLYDDFRYDTSADGQAGNDDINELTPKRRKAIYDKKKKGINRIVFNISQPAREIRDGTYLTGSDMPDGEKHFLWLSGHADLMDLLITNAVYTLGSAGQTSVSVNKIFQLITGDSRFRLEPKTRKEMLERIVRLTETDVLIRYRQDEYKGKFLYLETEDRFISYIKGTSEIEGNEHNGIKIKFTYTGTPTIFQYAETANMMWYIPLDWLLVTNRKKEKAVPDTPENIKLKAHIAWRIHMLPRYRTGYAPYDRKIQKNGKTMIQKEDSAVYKWISLLPSRSDRKGLYELLGIDVFEQDKKRKKTVDPDKIMQVQNTLKLILDHYVRKNIIKKFRFHSKEGIYTTIELDLLAPDERKPADISLSEPAPKTVREKNNKDKALAAQEKQELTGYRFTLGQEFLQKSSAEKKPAQGLELIPENVIKKLKSYTDTELSAFDRAVLSCVIQLTKNGIHRIVPKNVFSLLIGDKHVEPAKALRNRIISSIEKLRNARVKFKDDNGKVIYSASLLPLERSAGEADSVKTGSYRYKVPGIVSVLYDTLCTLLTEDKSSSLDVLDLLIFRAAASICSIEEERRDMTFYHQKMISNEFVFKNRADENKYLFLMKHLTVEELPLNIEKALNGDVLSASRDNAADDSSKKESGKEIIKQRLQKMIGKKINCSDHFKKMKEEKAAELRRNEYETQLECARYDEIIKTIDKMINDISTDINDDGLMKNSLENKLRRISIKLDKNQKMIDETTQKNNEYIQEQKKLGAEKEKITNTIKQKEQQMEQLKNELSQKKSKEEKAELKESIKTQFSEPIKEYKKTEIRYAAELKKTEKKIKQNYDFITELNKKHKEICQNKHELERFKKQKDNLNEKREMLRSQKRNVKACYNKLDKKLKRLQSRIEIFETYPAEVELFSVYKGNNELQFSYDDKHLISYLGEQTETLKIEPSLLYLTDKTGKDLVGVRYDELMLKIMLAVKLTQGVKTNKSEVELFFGKQSDELYGFGPTIKEAAFVPKRASSESEKSELRDKRFDQLCNKICKAAEYYKRMNIIESFEPIYKERDKKNR